MPIHAAAGGDADSRQAVERAVAVSLHTREDRRVETPVVDHRGQPRRGRLDDLDVRRGPFDELPDQRAGVQVRRADLEWIGDGR